MFDASDSVAYIRDFIDPGSVAETMFLEISDGRQPRTFVPLGEITEMQMAFGKIVGCTAYTDLQSFAIHPRHLDLISGLTHTLRVQIGEAVFEWDAHVDDVPRITGNGKVKIVFVKPRDFYLR